MRNGADIRSIQTWLGHAHLQTTALYLHTDEEQVRKIAGKASIRPVTTPEPAAASQPGESARGRHYLRRRSTR
jgi:hypothetical protein